MIASCKELDDPISTIVEDGEEFGGITEDTYCYTAPVYPLSLSCLANCSFRIETA